MDEVEDEPLFCERVAGIDIGKTTIMVTIRVPSDTRRGRRQQETREFRAVRKDLLALAVWLRCWGVTRIGMEATGLLLETGVLPARARRLRLRAVPRLPGPQPAGPAEDRPVSRRHDSLHGNRR